MSENGIPMDAWGECHRDGCTGVLPWDMSAIAFNGNVYCTPDCAREVLTTTDEPVEEITLHDPQFHAETPEGVPGKPVNLRREIQPGETLSDVLAEIEDLHEGPFRV